jgi:CDP-glucose 4,6-dehydratase
MVGNTLANFIGVNGKTLVTGHSGFKGTWMTLLLEKLGVEVIGLSLPPEEGSLFQRCGRVGAIQEKFLDIRNFEGIQEFLSLHNPTNIIHMAAQPLVLESYRSPRATFGTNVMGTVNLLDAAFRTDSTKNIVVVTTDKVYRNDNSGNRFVESDPLGGKDPYSASKVGTESVVSAWQQIHRVSGGPKVISVRAGNVIGGGDWASDRLLPDLVRGFIDGSPIKIRNSESTRPWQHVLDPLVGYLLALAHISEGGEDEVFNFGPDKDSLTVREVVRITKEVWPGKSEIEFSPSIRGLESEKLDLDSTLAAKVLGWYPIFTQEESIRKTFEWWQKVLLDSQDPQNACFEDIDFVLSKMRTV